MDIGQRLKQARLEAGLSQRQLCGDAITRNMLSQIENGSARPSMDTLQLLAGRLGKPISWFLDEENVSENQKIIVSARSAPPRQQLELLKDYHAPDPVFDPERYLMEALSCMALAETAIAENRLGYARSLLERAQTAGAQTPYYTADLERRRLLLCYSAGASAQTLVSSLPDCTQELLLRAQAEEDPQRRGRILDAAPTQTPQWHLLRADAYFAQKDFASAAEHYLQVRESKALYARLEQCYRELEDYKTAYFYACKQRETPGLSEL